MLGGVTMVDDSVAAADQIDVLDHSTSTSWASATRG
jgi:hypothetical protein